jgi:hypothetical protein
MVWKVPVYDTLWHMWTNRDSFRLRGSLSAYHSQPHTVKPPIGKLQKLASK